MALNYIKINEANNFEFYQIPKKLFSDEYNKIHAGAKILYGIMLSRVSLSIKHKWVDDNDNVYIRFSNDDMCEALNVCEKTVTTYRKQLMEYGLIEVIKVGMNDIRIYVKNINTPENDEVVKNSDIVVVDTSDDEVVKNSDIEVVNTSDEDININKYNNIDIQSVSGAHTPTPLSTAEYQVLVDKYTKPIVDTILDRIKSHNYHVNKTTIEEWCNEHYNRAKITTYYQPSKNQFSNHTQREYDFEELERTIWSNRADRVVCAK